MKNAPVQTCIALHVPLGSHVMLTDAGRNPSLQLYVRASPKVVETELMLKSILPFSSTSGGWPQSFSMSRSNQGAIKLYLYQFIFNCINQSLFLHILHELA